MKGYSYNKNTVEKFAISGILSDDGKTITYITADGDDAAITIEKCFKNFCGKDIDFAIATKDSKKLPLNED